MTQQEWSAQLAERVAGEVRRHRTRREMSAQQLADACTALGVPLSRSALANFESGRRPTVSVAELLVLGRALGVPPVELVFPAGRQEREIVEVLPGQDAGVWMALKWFTGEEPFPTKFPDDGRWYATKEDQAAHEESATFAYRWHETYTKQCLEAEGQARSARHAADVAASVGNDAESRAHSRAAKAEYAQYRMCRQLLRDHRERMRADGVIPPGLPEVLADLDTEP